MTGFTTNGMLMIRGAYGREATQADWDAGKDFQIVSGPYCSVRDLKRIKDDGYEMIVAYNRHGYVAFTVSLT